MIKVLPVKQAFFCPENSTVLDAALKAGLPLPHSCRGGNCGSCMARLNSGQCVHQHGTDPLGITDEQRNDGQVLLCQIQPRSELSISVRTPQADRMVHPIVQLPCRLVRRELVATDVMKIYLQLPRSQPLAFTPGQYIDLLLDRGRRRSYSMASISSDNEPLELHVRRVKNGYFSDQVFSNDTQNQLLRLEGPFGEFVFRDSPRDIIMVAGGTGFAPIKSILLSVLSTLESNVHFFWGARDEQDLYEQKLLTRLSSQHANFSFTPVVERVPHNGSNTCIGLVHQAVIAHYPNLAPYDIYASGPPAMIAALTDDFIVAGADSKQLYLDAFNYAV